MTLSGKACALKGVEFEGFAIYAVAVQGQQGGRSNL